MTTPIQGPGPGPQQPPQSPAVFPPLEWIHEIIEITNLLENGEKPFARINDLISQLQQAQPTTPSQKAAIQAAIQDLEKAKSLLRSQGPSENVVELVTFAGQALG